MSAILTPCAGYKHTILIKEDGVKKGGCYDEYDTIYCPSLQDALMHNDLTDSCIFLFERNTSYVINSLVTLNNVKHFALEAELSNQTIQCANATGCGVQFKNCIDVLITNMTFSFSVAAQVTSLLTPIPTPISSLLTFYQCDDVILSSINFIRVTGHSVVVADSSNIVANAIEVEGGVGSGFLVIFKEKDGISIDLSRVTFQDIRVDNKSESNKSIYNATSPAGKGAGLSVFFLKHVTMDNIRCYQCSFKRNKAIFGSGIFLYMAHGTRNNNVLINETVFDSNEAWASGGGMYISSSHMKSNLVHITDSNFTNNKAEHASGGGALFTYNSHLTMSGRVSVTENTGTAMVLGATLLEVRSGADINITGNSGVLGGAMFLFKCPTINVCNSSNVLFSRNWADADGGALFVFHEFEKKASRCFFDPQYRFVL